MSTQIDPRTAYPRPPFPKQEQDSPGLDSQMDPKPDYGLNSYKGTGKLNGRVAIITGGDSGIGRAVALAYAREGANVCINYLPVEEPDAQEIKKAIEDSGKECLAQSGDLTSPQFCKELINKTIEKFGRIDILVNNAAYQGKSVESLAELDHDRVTKTFMTNIVAMFDLTREALPHLQPGAVIINTASIQAYDPSAPILDYACTKAAIMNFTKGLAQQLAEKGIRVNAVAPGPVWTPLVMASFPPEKNATFGEKYPLKRPAQPAELAPAYVYLASDCASFTSGEILAVTGGMPTM